MAEQEKNFWNESDATATTGVETIELRIGG
jgi:hypothetical protein